MALTRVVLALLLAVVALNALGGGMYGVLGAEGVPESWLENSPFRTYFVPSLVLLVGVGGSATLAAFLLFRRAPMGRAAALAAGAILLVWIVVQVAIIGWVSWLQPTMAVAALAILVLASMRSDLDGTRTLSAAERSEERTRQPERQE